jgi:hypothetical protein
MLVTASTVVASAETVPQGTTLHCRLTETLSTRVSLQGDRFTATVSEPVALNGRDVSIAATQDFQIMYTGVDTVLSQEHDKPPADAVLSLRFVSLSKNADEWHTTCCIHDRGGTSNGTGPN